MSISSISGGTLRINGTNSGVGLVTVDAGGTLGGDGSIGGALVVSGVMAPGNSIGTLDVADDVTWNGSAGTPWVFELGAGNTADLLNITAGDFLQGTGSDFVFDFAGSTDQGVFDLVAWSGGTTFVVDDFSYANLGGGNTGSFAINGSTLQFVAVPEPATLALLGSGLLGLAICGYRRRQA